MRSYLDLISSPKRKQIEREFGKMDENLREKVALALSPFGAKDEQIDQAIAAVFDWLSFYERIDEWAARVPLGTMEESFAAMLAEARKDAEK